MRGRRASPSLSARHRRPQPRGRAGDIPVDVTARAAAAYQGKRVATVTAQLLSGRSAMVS